MSLGTFSHVVDRIDNQRKKRAFIIYAGFTYAHEHILNTAFVARLRVNFPVEGWGSSVKTVLSLL